MQTVGLNEAMKRMREYTKIGVRFSVSFLSFNESQGNVSDGIKVVHDVQLRMGYRDDQSNKSKTLIGYVTKDGANRWFYMPLLLSFNGVAIKQ